MKHTPGPWEYTTPGCHAIVVGDRIIASGGAESEEEYDQGAIDFKLIAAAPDMLAALLDLIPLIDMAFEYEGDVFGTRHNHAVDVLQLAVAMVNKATGVTP